jgi:hypothetical protein
MVENMREILKMILNKVMGSFNGLMEEPMKANGNKDFKMVKENGKTKMVYGIKANGNKVKKQFD